ncbi:MAG: hypothetical protein VR70_10860 [Rhodospirillaceae bacterium BRH_c57]|nr:MAG: hypothetical protein VR70_10860 [Rhodospirillaceae bacterium BRH_c57]
MDGMATPMRAWKAKGDIILQVAMGDGEGVCDLLMLDSVRGCFRPSNLAFGLVDHAEPMPLDEAMAMATVD